MSGWRDVALGEVIELKRGYDLPKRARVDGPFPIVSSSGISGRHGEAKVRGPGVVTGRYGTLGQVFYIAEDYWPLNTSLYVRDFKGNHPRFVAALLESMELGQHDGAAAVPGLNRNQLHTVPVRIPDRNSQERIAWIVESIDDLIENNRRRVEVLEEMAQAIYREWFVHFRYPGHEHVPLIDSPLGPIPDGWAISAVGHLASIDKGLSYKGAHLAESGTPMANLKCFRPGGGFRRDGAKPYDGPFKPRHQVSPGDLVMANTDLTQAGTVIGSPAFVPRAGFESGGIASHHLFIVRPVDGVARHWLYESFRDDRFRGYARGVASGTTVLGLRPLDLAGYQVPAPPPALAHRFDEIARGLANLREDLAELTEVLAFQRDLLLPKLVTGQIDVSRLDLEVLAEAATT